MMIWIPPFFVAWQCSLGEDGMLRLVEHELILAAGGECGIDGQARFDRLVADWRRVVRASHEQPGNFHAAERLFCRGSLGRAGTHRQGGLDSLLGEGEAAAER